MLSNVLNEPSRDTSTYPSAQGWRKNAALVMGFGALIILVKVSNAIASVVTAVTGSRTFRVDVIATMLGEILVMLVGVLLVTGGVSGWRRFLKVDRFNLKNLSIGIACGVGMWIALQIVSAIIKSITGEGVGVSSTENSLEALPGPWLIFLWLVGTPLIIPLLEETFFRGMVLSCFQSGCKTERWGQVLGVLFGSIWFSLIHVQGFSSVTDWFIITWTMTIGAINSILTLRQESIWCAFGLHATYNTVTVLASILLLS